MLWQNWSILDSPAGMTGWGGKKATSLGGEVLAGGFQ